MLIAGNWKMYKGAGGDGRVLPRAARPARVAGRRRRRRLPAVRLAAAAVQALAGTDIAVAAQNVHWEAEGAFTGEVSAPMLLELGVYGAIVGHSERRQLLRRDRRDRRASAPRAALEAGLSVIACVGETEAEREAGRDRGRARRQASPCSTRTSSSSSRTSRSGRSAPARPRRPEHRAGGARVHQVAARRAGPLRRLGEARQRGRAPRAAGRRRRARRRRLARRRLVRRDLPGRAPLVALVILDGWGCAPPGPGNAVELADTPVFDRLWAEYPHTTLEASGEAVGLPPGQMGNSEVGHLTIGSGRILYQDLMRVNKAIEDGSFFENPALRVGVRARPERPPARPRLVRRRPLAHRPPAGAAPLRAREDVDPRVHRRPRRLAARGRPRPRRAARRPDRDASPAATTRWTATSAGSGPSAPSTRSSQPSRRRDRIRPGRRTCSEYDAGVTDEFVEPVALRGPARARARRHGDLLQLPARPRAPALAAAARGRLRPDDDDALPRRPRLPGRLRGAGGDDNARRGARRARPPPAARRRDREVRARHLLLQRRPRGGVAGGDAHPRPDPARRRHLRPQAGDVGARGRGQVRAEIGDGYDFGIVNFANPDMVGHTGSIPAAIAAVETTDACLGDVVDAVQRGRRRRARHRRPRQRGDDARAGRRQPAHGAHDEPRAARRHGRRRSRCATAASSPISRRRASRCSGLLQPGGNDRAQPRCEP